MNEAHDCRILVIGEGVIGTVYAARLRETGADVTLFARGNAPDSIHVLQLEDMESGRETILRLPTFTLSSPATQFDLILVCVRAEQLMSTLPALAFLRDSHNVLFLGNLGGHVASIVGALGQRAMFGFPSVGGRRDGNRIVYVDIRQQETMIGEADGSHSDRARWIRDLVRRAGFRSAITKDIRAWLVAHAAFIVPIAASLARHGNDPVALGADPGGLEQMMRASRQAFLALKRKGNRQIPGNLVVLYLWMPTGFAVSYWGRVFRSPRGELWFAAHCRAAPAEIASMTEELLEELGNERTPVAALNWLLGAAPIS